MLKIGEFSKLARVSVKTLRYYADLGLFKPAYVDRYSGYRYYSLEQLPRLNRILALKELGFSLVQIEQMVREDLGAGELQRLMRLKHAELAQQVAAEQARLERVAVRLRHIEQEGRLPQYEVRSKRVERCEVVGIRDTISAYGDVGELLRELWSHLDRRSLAAAGPSLAIYYDAEYREQASDIEVAVPVAARGSEGRHGKANTRVLFHTLPAMEAASVIHTGDYDGLSTAYNALVAWTQSHGYRAEGPNREVYLQGPGTDVKPVRYITEVQFPVQPRMAALPETKEGLQMEPRIVTKEAFTVVGIPFKGFPSSGPFEDGENNNEIGKVWDELNARAAEIKHWSGAAIGLCFSMPNHEEPWYIAGAEVSQVENVPAGMILRHVAAQKYAVFECTLPKIGQTYAYITEQWQAASGYEHVEAPDFELYDEKWDNNDPQGSPMYIYWPIR